MTELFESGRVGTKNGTDEEIINRWKDVGILEFISEDLRGLFALKAEDIAYTIIKAGDSAYMHDLSKLSIPCLARVFREIDKKEVNEEIKIETLESIDSNEFISLINDNYGAMFNLVLNMHSSELYYGYNSDRFSIDLDADALAYISEMISNKYVYRYNLKRRIREEFWYRFFEFRSTEDKEWLKSAAESIGAKLDSHIFPENKEDGIMLLDEYIRQKKEEFDKNKPELYKQY
jgi:hypothetical protein